MKRISSLLFVLSSLLIFFYASKLAYDRHQINLNKSFARSDIEAIWKEGQRVCNFKNPYSRIHNKKNIFKPPTYFPGFYITSCVMQKIAGGFKEGLHLWSAVNSIIYFSMGAIFYFIFIKKSLFFLGLFSACICYFSKWSLHTLGSMQTNFIGLLPLILSILLIKSKPRLSLFLFGVSLFFKQIAIFLVPLFVFKDYTFDKKIVKNVILISAIPLLLSLPFLIDDFSGFLKSILYSANRRPKSLEIFSSNTKVFVMYILMFFTYFWYYRNQIKLSIASVVIFITFVSLNRIFFSQYYLWLLFIILVTIYDIASSLKAQEKGKL